jgi:hypothetical protein
MRDVTATEPAALEMQPIIEEFFREGCVLVPGILNADEVAALRAKTDELAADPNTSPRHISYVGETFVLRYCHEADPLFAATAEHPSVMNLAAAVLDSGVAFNAMNVIRNGPGQAISRWHIDDRLEMPLPDEIARFDPRICLPVLWLTIQVALSDIDTLENGPSQFVPGVTTPAGTRPRARTRSSKGAARSRCCARRAMPTCSTTSAGTGAHRISRIAPAT